MVCMDDKKTGEMNIQEIHAVLIELFNELVKVCQKHNFALYLTGGSVLGAVRHNGFIPWDDDIDVALPRYDYKKLFEVAEKELPSHLKLVWISRACHYRLVDTRHRVKLNDNYSKILSEKEYECVAIDIQPFDGVPTGVVGTIHCFRVMAFRALYKMCSPERVIYDEKWRKKWEIWLIRMIKLFSFALSDEDYWRNKYLEAMQKYDYADCNVIADFVGKYKFNDVYPKKWWEPGLIVDFENVKAMIPSEYDKYLSKIYGKYMEIPKENEKVIHLDSHK